jgi:pyruvate dehydrogenase E1 component alpha subunit
MKSAGMIDAAGIAALDREVIAEVEDAVAFAEESPDPAPEALYTDVLAGGR